MEHHNNHINHTKVREVIQSKISLDRGVHFPNIEVLDHALANEVGLSPDNQSAHWNVNSARLFNHFPVFTLQYMQLSSVNVDKSGREHVSIKLPSESYDEFIDKYQLEEQSIDVPDTIWIS